MRQAGKRRRKRYGAYDSRGRLAGKRHISERPAEVEGAASLGHWEIDTVMGNEHGRNSVMTLVERRHRLPGHGQARPPLRGRGDGAHHRADRPPPRAASRTVTADNGTEFHSYAEIEAATGTLFYFATPHHSWERGTNENTNGLMRQYLPKRQSMAHVTQADCDAIAAQAQRAAAEAARLQDTGGVLCTSQVGESVRGTSVGAAASQLEPHVS